MNLYKHMYCTVVRITLFNYNCCSPKARLEMCMSMLLIFLVFCSGVLYCFVCRRPESCVPYVTSVSRLFIFVCPIRFSLTFIWLTDSYVQLASDLTHTTGKSQDIYKFSEVFWLMSSFSHRGENAVKCRFGESFNQITN